MRGDRTFMQRWSWLVLPPALWLALLSGQLLGQWAAWQRNPGWVWLVIVLAAVLMAGMVQVLGWLLRRGPRWRAALACLLLAWVLVSGWLEWFAGITPQLIGGSLSITTLLAHPEFTFEMLGMLYRGEGAIVQLGGEVLQGNWLFMWWALQGLLPLTLTGWLSWRWAQGNLVPWRIRRRVEVSSPGFVHSRLG